MSRHKDDAFFLGERGSGSGRASGYGMEYMDFGYGYGVRVLKYWTRIED